MGNIDKRNQLDLEMFSYRTNKNNIVFIEYYGKQIMILKGKEANAFLNKTHHAKNEKERQLIMAKITGNFKRGNEQKRNNTKY
ncbi:hypothetical protein AAIE21_00105 [Paenibacillus sp. 102]|uniref:hypothetical protein n=1 Tax=Paenibacillus sp. 102 TaxID=3120823 RepID=UPI0031B9F5A6